jgi:hypothetical protein
MFKKVISYRFLITISLLTKTAVFLFASNTYIMKLPPFLEQTKAPFVLRIQNNNKMHAYVQNYQDGWSCFLEWEPFGNQPKKITFAKFLTPEAKFLGFGPFSTLYFRDDKGVFCLLEGNRDSHVRIQGIEVQPNDVIRCQLIKGTFFVENQTTQKLYIITGTKAKQFDTATKILYFNRAEFPIGMTPDLKKLWILKDQRLKYFDYQPNENPPVTALDEITVHWHHAEPFELIYSVAYPGREICFYKLTENSRVQLPIDDVYKECKKATTNIEFDKSIEPLLFTKWPNSEQASDVVFCNPKATNPLDIIEFASCIEPLDGGRISGISHSTEKTQPRLLISASSAPRKNLIFAPSRGWFELKQYLKDCGCLPVRLNKCNFDQEGVLCHDSSTKKTLLFGRAGDYLYVTDFRAVTQLHDPNTDFMYQFVSASPHGSVPIIKGYKPDPYYKQDTISEAWTLENNYFGQPECDNGDTVDDIVSHDGKTIVCEIASEWDESFSMYQLGNKSFSPLELRKKCFEAKVAKVQGDHAVGSYQLKNKELACYWCKQKDLWMHFPISPFYPSDLLVTSDNFPLGQEIPIETSSLKTINGPKHLMVGHVKFPGNPCSVAFVTQPLKKSCLLPLGPFLLGTKANCLSSNGLSIGGQLGDQPCVWESTCSSSTAVWDLKCIGDLLGEVIYVNDDASVLCGTYNGHAAIWKRRGNTYQTLYLKDLLDADQKFELIGTHFGAACFAFADNQTFFVNGKCGEKICYL